MSNEIIKDDTSISLDFPTVTGATKYHCRISRYYDFSIIPHEDNNIAASTSIYAFTLTAGNYKYYWNWRAYVSGAWQKWNEVQSFEKKASGGDLSISDGKWMMFEAAEMADYTLVFDSAPNYNFVESQLYRTQERNLAGDLLSEFWTTKGKIHLEWGENNTISRTEKDQIMRYFGMNNLNVYLACAPASGSNYYRKLWKVWFVNEPEIRPLPGNEERFIMTLDLEER